MVRAAGGSKAVICFSRLQTCTNSAVGVKEANKKIFFLLLFSVEKMKASLFQKQQRENESELLVLSGRICERFSHKRTETFVSVQSDQVSVHHFSVATLDFHKNTRY